jgi:transcriptional regulator with XRE-family HTH domain
MDDDAQIFANAVRAARVVKGLSLAQLSASSGVSRAMLSKVERGEKSPTLPVACRIAQGLQVSMSQLLGANASEDTFIMTTLKQRLTFRDADTGFCRELLSPPLESFGTEILRHIIPVGQSSGELPAYASGFQKFVIVESGNLRISIGQKAAELADGDALCFEPNENHQFSNTGSKQCSYYVVTSLRPLRPSYL